MKILFRYADASVKVHNQVCGEALSYDNDRGIEDKILYNPTSRFLSQDVYPITLNPIATLYQFFVTKSIKLCG